MVKVKFAMLSFKIKVYGVSLLVESELEEAGNELLEEYRDHLTGEPTAISGTIRILREEPVLDHVPDRAVRISTVFPSSSVYSHGGRVYFHDEGNFSISVDPSSLSIDVWASPKAKLFEKLRYLSKHLLITALERKGTMWIHGSASSYGSGALLFTGVSGSGKTTCLLAMIARGHRMVTDDVILLENGKALPFYMRSMVHSRTLERFPDLKPHLSSASVWDEKADGSWLNLGKAFGVEQRPLPPKALFNTHVWNSDGSECRSSPPVKAVPKLMRNYLLESGSVFEPPQDQAKRAFAAYSSLAEAIPCFDLYVGRDTRGLIDAIEGALR
uniref:HPr kinase/phosphorylase C-terminal domain-containing protein n=1 Tax=Candidatus Methanomethylicus mesodigestus TaxID=1867258 RepID=A0A7C3IXQ6_9CREN